MTAKTIKLVPDERRAERERKDAERGIHRCGVTNGIGQPCASVVAVLGNMCLRHDPARIAEREAAERAEQAELSRREFEAKGRRLEEKVRLESGVQVFERRLQSLRQDDFMLRQAIDGKRAQLVELEHKREAESAEVVSAAGELLAVARRYLAQAAESMNREDCDLAIRCAEALTNHSRESRLVLLAKAAPKVKSAPKGSGRGVNPYDDDIIV